MWCIPARDDARFVCQMEGVLEVYKRSLDPRFPVVCMDESSVQCTREVRTPLPTQPGRPARYDAEYERNGVAHLLLFYAPFESWRRIAVRSDHTALTWAEQVRRLVEEDYPQAERITLVMDNLSTHDGASFYKAFEPAQARALMQRLEFVFTPKHGSWLNLAECEFSVLARQCLRRRLPDQATVAAEVGAWVNERNRVATAVDWRFTAEDARIKLKRLYPKLLH